MPSFQLINNVRMVLASQLAWDSTELVVRDSDLSDAEKYDPTKVLALTLVGDEELNQYEIVYATQRTGTTFTISRGEEDTTAGDWPSGTALLAAMTASVLTGVAQAPTSGDQVSYGGGNFGSSGTVEETLDDMGDAIITLSATDTEFYESVEQRISGPLFSPGATNFVDLRWQAGAIRLVTAGFGVVVSATAPMAAPTIPPDLVLALRCSDISNFGNIKVTAQDAAGTNKMEWNVASSQIPSNNAWALVFLAASSATLTGTPATSLPTVLKLDVNDDSTGPLTIDMNFVDVVPVRNSYLGAFLHVKVPTDWNKVDTIAKFGFRVSCVINPTDIPTIGAVEIREAMLDGHRIYATSTANFKAQTKAQILTTLFNGLRTFFNESVDPDGWFYNNGWNGPLDLEPATSVRELVAAAYKEGVGVGDFRSAVEVYRFDDPIHEFVDLAEAQTALAGSNKLAINGELSALSVADLNTLFAAIVTSRNFYSTVLDYQNADNLKSGTVDPARLPVVPVNKGGTGVDTIEEARLLIGVPVGGMIVWPSDTMPTEFWLPCGGQTLSKSAYPELAAMLGAPFNVDANNFKLPDLRGRVVAGTDDLGATAAGRLTTAGGGIDGALLGAVGGAQGVALSLTQLPSHTHTQQGAHAGGGSAAYAGDHQHYGAVVGPTQIQQGGYASYGAVYGYDGLTGGHTHSVSVSTTLSGQTGASGSGSAHFNVQPTICLNWIIRAR
jgi:microcystin-dependent protein